VPFCTMRSRLLFIPHASRYFPTFVAAVRRNPSFPKVALSWRLFTFQTAKYSAASDIVASFGALWRSTLGVRAPRQLSHDRQVHRVFRRFHARFVSPKAGAPDSCVSLRRPCQAPETATSVA